MIDTSKKPIQINLSREAFKYIQDGMRMHMTENNTGGSIAQEVLEELKLN